MQKFLLIGLDNSNLGDDLLYISALELMSKIDNSFVFYLKSERIVNILKQIDSISCEINLFNGQKYQKVLHIGGTVLTSHQKIRTRVYGLFKNLLPISDCDIIMSLGVDKKIANKSRWKTFLNRNKPYLLVRDVESFISLWNNFKYTKSSILFDSVFTSDFVLSFAGNINNDVELIIPRKWPFDKNIEKEQLNLIKSSVNTKIMLFASSDNDSFPDFDYSYDGTYDSLCKLLSVISLSSNIITSRYHGIVLAIMFKKKYNPFYIDEKLKSLDDYFNSDRDEHENKFDLQNTHHLQNIYIKALKDVLSLNK